MKTRRSLLLALVGLCLPLGVKAQQSKRMATLGILIFSNPEPFLGLFRQGLRKLGYVEDRDHRLEVRHAHGNAELLARQAEELVRLKVDVLVALPTPAAIAAKRATREIPIVLGAVGDPVGSGLVESLARPGGNVTGVSTMNTETTAKLLEVIRELRPSAKRIAVLVNAADPFSKLLVEQIQAAGRIASVGIVVHRIQNPGDIEAAYWAASRGGADAVITQATLARKTVVELALKHRLPLFASSETMAEAGALASYSASFSELFLETASYVDKILKGAKPSELPIQQPVKYSLVINQRTARALGIAIPNSIVLRADRVIE